MAEEPAVEKTAEELAEEEKQRDVEAKAAVAKKEMERLLAEQAAEMKIRMKEAKEKADKAAAIKKAKTDTEECKKMKDLLKHSDPKKRGNAAQTLGFLGQYASPAMADLIEAMQGDCHLGVRNNAAVVLGNLGEFAEFAIPELQKVARLDSVTTVRFNAKKAIQQILQRLEETKYDEKD